MGGGWGGSNAVFQLVVVSHVRRVLLIDEEKRRFIWSVLCRGGVPTQVCDGGVGGGRGSRRIQAIHVVATLRGLGRAIQTGSHQAILVLGPRDLKGREQKETFTSSRSNLTTTSTQFSGRKTTNLDELQVGESSDIEVRCVLLHGDAVVELAVAPTDGERLRPVGSAQRGGAVQSAEVGW